MLKKTMVYLEEEQHEALRILAFETKVTMSEHIRQAIDEYLKKIKEEK